MTQIASVYSGSAALTAVARISFAPGINRAGLAAVATLSAYARLGIYVDGAAALSAAAGVSAFASVQKSPSATLTAAAYLIARASDMIGIASIRPLSALGSNGKYSLASASFEPLWVEATGGFPSPDWAVAAGNIFLTSVGSGLTGETGGGDTAFRALVSLASNYLYAYGSSQLHPLLGLADSGDGLTDGTLISIVDASFDKTLTAEAVYYLELNSAFTLDGTLESAQLVVAEMLARAGLDDNIEAAALLQALISAEANIVFGTALLNELFDCVVVNTNTLAASLYEGYKFNSFANLGGIPLGGADDGIYELTGATDDSVPIRAAITLPETSFGGFGQDGSQIDSPEKKTLANAYIGVSSDGLLQLKTRTDDGVERFYSFSKHTGDFVNERASLAKGVKSRLWQIELLNVDGSDFSLDFIELLAVKLSRKV